VRRCAKRSFGCAPSSGCGTGFATSRLKTGRRKSEKLIDDGTPVSSDASESHRVARSGSGSSAAVFFGPKFGRPPDERSRAWKHHDISSGPASRRRGSKSGTPCRTPFQGGWVERTSVRPNQPVRALPGLARRPRVPPPGAPGPPPAPARAPRIGLSSVGSPPQRAFGVASSPRLTVRDPGDLCDHGGFQPLQVPMP
jgi:hypothetical protein